jgi:hypothetical protein
MRMRGEGMNEGRADGSCYLCLSWELGILFKFLIFYQCSGISVSAEQNNTKKCKNLLYVLKGSTKKTKLKILG